MSTQSNSEQTQRYVELSPKICSDSLKGGQTFEIQTSFSCPTWGNIGVDDGDPNTIELVNLCGHLKR